MGEWLVFVGVFVLMLVMFAVIDWLVNRGGRP